MAHVCFGASDLKDQGPIVEVLVVPPPALRELIKNLNIPAPPPVSARFMVDTGAQQSCIRPGLLSHHVYQPVGTGTISTASDDAVEVYKYSIQVVLPGDAPVPPITAYEVPQLVPGLDGLIGRDLLNSTILIYDGIRNQITLSV